MGSLRDFYLGVVDFLAVLLPGALVVGAAIYFGISTTELQSAVGPVKAESVLVAAFIATAFAVGQVCNAVGSLALDHVYDLLYAPGSGWLSWRTGALDHCREWLRSKRAYRLASAKGRDKNWWGALGLRIVLALLALLPRIVESGSEKRGADLKNDLRSIAKGGDVGGVYQAVRAYLKLSKPEAFNELEKLEGDQKFFRSITIGSLVIALALWFKDRAVLWHYIWPCWLLAALAVVRYISLRRKAVERAFIYFALRDVPKGTEGPAK